MGSPDEKEQRKAMAAQRKAMKQNLSLSELIEAQREDEALLASVQEQVEELRGITDDKDLTREYFEAAYSLNMQVLYSMARRFHPRSAYAASMLERATELRREYESKIGSYTVYLTPKNVQDFRTVLTDDLREEISCGKSFGLGAARSDRNNAFGAGAIVYEITNTAKEGLGFRVKWLYVDEDFRGRDIVHSLLGELIAAADRAGIEHIIVDVPLGNEWLLVLGSILMEWKFDLTTRLFPDAVIRISEIKRPARIAMGVDDVKSFSERSPVESREMMRNYLGRNGYHGFLLKKSLPQRYIDWNLSCYIGPEHAPRGMILVHQKPSGKVCVEYLEAESEKMSLALTRGFVLNSIELCDKSSDLIFPVRGVKSGRIFDELFPKQRGMYLVEGVLGKTPVEIRTEDVEQFLALSGDGLRDHESEFFEIIQEVN